jgi:hypothetical protein
MNILLTIALIVFLLDKIIQYIFNFFGSNKPKKESEVPINNCMMVVNEFIRKEAAIEILKWITEGKILKNTNTQNTALVSQLRDGEEIKKRVSSITSIITSKISPDMHRAFNKVYKAELEKVDDNNFVDIGLHTYIARYIFFLFRKLSYDITVLINSPEYSTEQLDVIINGYIVSLEETIYKENTIYLINDATLSQIEK